MPPSGRRRDGALLGTSSGFSTGRSSWQAALLAASILSSCFLLIHAQDTPVTVEPSQPLEGQDVTLTPGGSPTFTVCMWFRGEEAERNRIFTYIPSLNLVQQNGSGFTRREIVGPNCSLSIRSLALNDTGNYKVLKTGINGSEKGHVHIEVLEVHPSLGAGAIVGIVLGSLATAALAGSLLYCFFRTRRQKDKNSMNRTSPVYENTRPSAQVKPENSSDINHTYEELQYKSQPEYDQLRW